MATTSSLPAEAPESNSFARLLGALFSPTATFQSIVRKPTWLVPVILIALISLGVVGLFGKKNGWASYFQRQDEATSRFQEMPRKQQEQTLQAQVKVGPISGYVGAVVAPFVEVAVIALVFAGIFNLIAGTQIKFSTSMGIVAYALTPLMISGLLGIVILYLKDPSTVDLQNLVASNAGAFLSGNSPRWLVSLLASLDVFSLWTMSLLAIGFSAAAPRKLSFGKAFLYIFAVWFLYVAVKVGATAMVLS